MTADSKRASRYFLYFPAAIKQLRVYLDGGGASSGSQILRGIIYNEFAGQPGQGLIRSFQARIQAGTPAAVTLPLPYRLQLNPATTARIHSGEQRVARFANPRPSSRRFNIDSYINDPTTPSPHHSQPIDRNPHDRLRQTRTRS